MANYVPSDIVAVTLKKSNVLAMVNVYASVTERLENTHNTLQQLLQKLDGNEIINGDISV